MYMSLLEQFISIDKEFGLVEYLNFFLLETSLNLREHVAGVEKLKNKTRNGFFFQTRAFIIYLKSCLLSKLLLVCKK